MTEQRVTSKQVDNLLQGWENAPTQVIADICRDWLDMRDRLALVAPLVAAVREAGEWPQTVFNPHTHEDRCVHCQRFVISRGPHVIHHAESCPGVRIAAALAGLEGAADG